jgi:hypothetical protein
VVVLANPLEIVELPGDQASPLRTALGARLRLVLVPDLEIVLVGSDRGSACCWFSRS